MSLAILFHFLCAQHVSDINISIIRSWRIFCWITTFVVLFLVRCVLVFRCSWVEAVLQPATQILLQPNYKWHPVGLLFFNYHNDARSNKYKIPLPYFDEFNLTFKIDIDIFDALIPSFGIWCFIRFSSFNPLTPNDPYSDRTAPLTSKRCILYIFSTNIGTEFFKHDIYSPFFPLQNAVCFIILTYLVPVY